jgi:superoxide dismutase, Cu-Zn family
LQKRTGGKAIQSTDFLRSIHERPEPPDEIFIAHRERGGTMKGTSAAIALLAGFFLVAFSVQGATKGEPKKEASPKGGKAMALLRPTEGNKTSGVITFTREKNGVRVIAVVSGLTTGLHGFHIHEKGDCSAPDAESAGGHFNPAGNPHAGPADQKRHAGDLGNLEGNVYENVYYETVDRVISLDGPDSIIGRAVIVHAGQDDLKTQPSGGAGARVACGVIRIEEK